MDLFSKRNIKKLLKEQGLTSSKGLGQHFLINKRIAEKILKAAGLKPNDIVLEIGPGIGNLTQELAKIAKKIIAVEKDRKMCELLERCNIENVQIINKDVLKLKIKELFKNLKLKIKNYKIVANLPYYISSPVIRKFLESDFPPEIMVLMVQKEVAQRICAGHRGKKSTIVDFLPRQKMNLLAVSVQFYAEPKIISFVKKENFWPRPKVDSAIIKIAPFQIQNKQIRGPSSNQLFFKVVKAGFSQPRKQLVNNLAKGLNIKKDKIAQILLETNINPSQRAETLTIEDWRKLATKLSSYLFQIQ